MKPISLLAPLAVAAIAAAPAQAAVDTFLNLDGIVGESTDSKHKGEIEVASFSWGASNPSTIRSTGGGGGAGRVSFQDLSFTSHVSKASPKLLLACASGQHIKKAVLSCRKAGGEQVQQDFLVITLTEVLVSSYQSGGSAGDDLPGESLSLNFGKIEYKYSQQNSDGKIDSSIQSGYDLIGHKVLTTQIIGPEIPPPGTVAIFGE